MNETEHLESVTLQDPHPKTDALIRRWDIAVSILPGRQDAGRRLPSTTTLSADSVHRLSRIALCRQASGTRGPDDQGAPPLPRSAEKRRPAVVAGSDFNWPLAPLKSPSFFAL